MKKKILISFLTVILTVSLLCFSSFASTENFNEVVSLSYVNIRDLTVGEDYNRVISSGSTYEESKAYAIEQGVPEYQYFYCGFYFNTPSISGSSTEGSTARLGSSASPFYNGYYINAKLTFKLYCDFRNGSTPDFQYMYIKARTSSSQGVWNWSSLPTVGSIEYSDFKQDSNGGWYCDCTAIVSYKNTGETIDDESILFMLCVKGNSVKPFYASVYTYTPYVFDYYYGDGSEPNAPIYENPSSVIGDTYEDFLNDEHYVFNRTEDGHLHFETFVNDIGDLIGSFGSGLLAITRFFDYIFIRLEWLNSLIRIFLALGLVGFVLNLGSSIAKGLYKKFSKE